tara:strand:+ start:463 stop:1284 length:822 start_codon:yes stop_codon:yes gene_type:complete
MNKLFAGPYDHEFGHELFSFQARVRAMTKNYEEIVVCTKPQMNFLYKDFAVGFVDCNDNKRIESYKDYDNLSQEDCRVNEFRGLVNYKQRFVRYGQVIDDKYDLVFHARTKKCGMCPNLPLETWDLVYQGLKDEYKIAFVGTKQEAYCPEGAKDLRGLPLSDLADVMRSSKLVAGYSSGPIHFASLCGTPHLTWGGHRLRTIFRYTHVWNPFKTPCYVFENLEDMGYLKRRARFFRTPLDLFERKYVNLIDCKTFKMPTVNDLLIAIRKILNG